jgi:hypothetical protein
MRRLDPKRRTRDLRDRAGERWLVAGAHDPADGALPPDSRSLHIAAVLHREDQRDHGAGAGKVSVENVIARLEQRFAAQ